MIVHGPLPHVPSQVPYLLPCCGRLLQDAEPGMVTCDPLLVNCDARFDGTVTIFGETFHRLADVEEFSHVAWTDGDKTTFSWWRPGSWVTLDGGTIDVTVCRDLGQMYGERWRPWKRHLHHRWLPVPRRVRRWFGWRPPSNTFRTFIEEWENP